MRTLPTASAASLGLFLFLLPACGDLGGGGGGGPGGPTKDPPAKPPVVTPVDPGALPKSAYDPARDGFVVHEWGTLTSVVGSDGSLLPGLHHEEEDLPAFVADRLAEAKAVPGTAVDPTKQKMETPVTYFYSPAPRKVAARVGFPSGMLTQWYPYVQAMYPPVYTLSGGLADRYRQQIGDIPQQCRQYFMGDFNSGMLDWGTVEVQAPGAQVALPGPLGNTSWGFARNTAANPLRVAGGSASGAQYEKFLFYRGLGNFALPLAVRFSGERPVFTNADPKADMRGLFLMVVTRDRAGFAELGDLNAALPIEAALPEPALDHAAFVKSLKARLAGHLIDNGLYTDEALAMVDTWERAYFLTPGVRLLYLLPQTHTDAIIPLAIEPAPDKLSRTMVIRVELLPPSYEKTLSASLTRLASGSPSDKDAARSSFLSLGRFAEPQLSRAQALSANDAERQAAESLLAEVRAHKRWAPLAAE